jgi:cytochrome c oxidase subunit III
MSVMGEVLPYRPPRERADTTAFLGMVLFLASWAMMFAALFFGYAVLRARSPSWPPPGAPHLPLVWPAANTGIIALSSVLLQWGLTRLRNGKSGSWGLLAGAAVMGLAFLGLQTFLWTMLSEQGLRPSTGAYGSVFFGLTWVHALHVAVGVVGLARVATLVKLGTLSPAKHLPVRLWTMYWHFVGIIWAVMFVSVFWM